MKSTRRLKHVATMRAGGTPPVADSSMWAEDGVPWVAISDMTRSATVTDTERRVSPLGINAKNLPVGAPGTILFAMYASVGALGVLQVSATWNQAILGIEPIPDLAEPRFVSYWLRYMRANLGSLFRSNTQDNLNADQVANIPFLPISFQEQREIADFLDIETARIDALVAKKLRLIALVRERVNQSMSAILAEYGFNFPGEVAFGWKTVSLPCGWRVIRLSQVLVKLTNGYVGPTRDILVDSGVRYIQSLHIKDGDINFDRRPFYVSDDWHSARPRIHLCAGDVLIVQTGDIGKVAVVPEEFGPASCHALQIARVRWDMLSGAFLAEYLRTPFGYESLLSRATGALHPHLEGGIRDIPIILPPKEIQTVILRRVGGEREHQKKLESRLVRQIAILRERRQRLITAAVTGEMDVPGVPA